MINEPTKIGIPVDKLEKWISLCDEIENPVVLYHPEPFELAQTVYYSNRSKAEELKKMIREYLQ